MSSFCMETLSDAIVYLGKCHIQATGSAQERRVLARVIKGSKQLAANRSMKASNSRVSGLQGRD